MSAATVCSRGAHYPASADPGPQTVIQVDANGSERESRAQAAARHRAELKEHLWSLLETEGQTLAALNAAIFASELDEKVATRIVAARKTVAEKIIRNYCVAKGLLVALNPVPVTDLLAAAGTDIAMVIHLGEVYWFQAVAAGRHQAVADDFGTIGRADGRLLGHEPGFQRP